MSTRATLLLTSAGEHWYRETTNGWVNEQSKTECPIVLQIGPEHRVETADNGGTVVLVEEGTPLHRELREAFRPRSDFSSLLRAAGAVQVGAPLLAFQCTLTEDPARRILEAYDLCIDEGHAPKFDAILRAIAAQHPVLVEEFSHLPWPMRR